MTKSKEKSIRVYGFEFRNINNFKGHEGEPLSQADLYYKGEKVGFVSENSHGGIVPDTRIPDREMREKFEKAGEELKENLDSNPAVFPSSLITQTLFALESFLEHSLKFAKKHDITPQEVDTICVLDTNSDYVGDRYQFDILDTESVISYYANNGESKEKIITELKEKDKEKIVILEGKEVFSEEGLTDYEIVSIQ